MERRMMAGCEIRAEPDAGGDEFIAFSGYAAVFGERSEKLGDFYEVIAPGAFAETLARGDDVRALVNHNPERVLGRRLPGTLTLEEDERGLKFTVRAPNAQWVRDLKLSVDRGDINQCSFGFDCDGERWETDPDQGETRTVTRARLYDISIVTFPAYAGTSVEARSAEDIYRAHKTHRSGAARVLRDRLALHEKEMGTL